MVTVDLPCLEFRGNGSILLGAIACARHANVRSSGCGDFTLDLDIAERGSCFSSQRGVHKGLLRRPIWLLGEEMMPNFMRKRTCDSGALPDGVLVNDDLHTGNKIGAATGWPPFDTQVVVISLCKTRSKCWGFGQKRYQRRINQRRSRTMCGPWSATLLRL
ncbi:hypothetical protein A7326_01165 [Stenotrophomonas maltophilia]|nr:hypothetical protein A7326_01165 [Stenotrophomonas maltophilia]